MDIDLIRTFLEVNRTRHFARAAERLFVTPAAVSARVRLLEDHLGTRLFVRSRGNIRLTSAGQRLLPHAGNLLRTWNRAMHSVGSGDEYLELVSLGSLHSIWSALLKGWLPHVYGAHGELMLQLDLLTTPELVARIREQSVDLALLYDPPRASDLASEEAGTLALTLVADRPGLAIGNALPGYVHVDWGTAISMTLARDLPGLPEPTLRVDSPEVAYEFLLHRGGAAYLPRLLVHEDLHAGRLHLVQAAPPIERSVYLIQSAHAAESAIRSSVRESLLDWLGARLLR